MELSNQNKKLLIFIDWYEPGFKGGGPIRSIANFVANMQHQFEIYLFTSDRDHGDTQPYENVILDQWLRREGFQVFYASPQSQTWKAILREIKKVAPGFIYINSMYSRFFALYPMLMKRFGTNTAEMVLAPRGMLQQGALAFKAGKKKFFLKLLNWLGISPLIRTHATDLQEQEDIQKYLPGVKSVEVIPNFSVSVAATASYIIKYPHELKIIFISRVSPKKNLLFLLQCLNHLPNYQNIYFTIRGSVEDAGYWEACGQIIEGLPSNINVSFEGPIDNKQVPQLLEANHLFVLPTLGENFGHAIIEALSVGRPVLISDQTPWRNLAEQKAGWDLPLNQAERFVKVLTEIAEMDNGRFQEWSRGAWQFAQNYQKSLALKEKYCKLFS